MAPVRWLDDREEAAWRGLLRAHARLTAELSRRLAAQSSLSYQDYEVMVALTDQQDGRLRLYELGDLLGWEKSRVSHHVSRMANRGLVRKVPCGTDRRGAFVAATARGRREIEAAAPGHVEAVRDLFVDRLTPAELGAIVTITEKLPVDRTEPS
jgi:DNA-binding MarR family transcriptional regulator